VRTYGPDAASLLAADRVVELYLFEFEFVSGTVRHNSSSWDIEWDGKNWLRGDGLFGVKFPKEDVTGAANAAVVTLSAMNEALLSRALSERVRGRPATIFHMVMNPDTFAIVSVSREFSGLMSQLTITAEGSFA
jgi:hypothetical protein